MTCDIGRIEIIRSRGLANPKKKIATNKRLIAAELMAATVDTLDRSDCDDRTGSGAVYGSG